MMILPPSEPKRNHAIDQSRNQSESHGLVNSAHRSEGNPVRDAFNADMAIFPALPFPADSMPSRTIAESAFLDGWFPRFDGNPRFRAMTHERTETGGRIGFLILEPKSIPSSASALRTIEVHRCGLHAMPIRKTALQAMSGTPCL